MHRNLAVGPRSRNMVSASQACLPKVARVRVVNASGSATEEVQQLRDELDRVRKELSDLRAATSTFVRGLM